MCDTSWQPIRITQFGSHMFLFARLGWQLAEVECVLDLIAMWERVYCWFTVAIIPHFFSILSVQHPGGEEVLLEQAGTFNAFFQCFVSCLLFVCLLLLCCCWSSDGHFQNSNLLATRSKQRGGGTLQFDDCSMVLHCLPRYLQVKMLRKHSKMSVTLRMLEKHKHNI